MDSDTRKGGDMANKTYRPEQLATHLGVSGKLLRGYLRATFPRAAEAKGTTWVVTAEQAAKCIEHFESRRSPVTPDAE
jgi:hypothetical protein